MIAATEPKGRENPRPTAETTVIKPEERAN
jgi:hypothetical protein